MSDWPNIDESFPRAYEVEVVQELPGGPRERHFYLPDGNTRGGHDGFLLRVKPHSGQAWTALCAHGRWGGLNGFYSWPDELGLGIVTGGAGFLVRVDDPERPHEFPVQPVTDIAAVPKRGMILVVGDTQVVAYDRTGLIWQTSRLAWDSLRIVAVGEDSADLVGFDAPGDDFPQFRLDLATGLNDGTAYSWDDSKWREPPNAGEAGLARLRRLVSRSRGRASGDR